ARTERRALPPAMTKLTPVMGFPLAHSISPQIYAAAYPAVGVDARCDPWAIPPANVETAVKQLRGDDFFGACVTVPHKETVIAFLDGVAENAQRMGAVNCIHNASGVLTGHNTDVYGFMRALEEAGFAPSGRRALLLGAGGSARAVAVG